MITQWNLKRKEWLDWMAFHSRAITFSVAGVIVAVFALFQVLRASGNNHYVATEIAYQNWVEGEEGEREAFAKLDNLLDRQSILHAKYDPLIVERLLQLGETKRAEPYANATFKRLGNETPYHTAFSKTSLLIAQKSYSAALEQAKKLKTSMEADTAFWQAQSPSVRFGSCLYAFNLLRIAMLEQEIGASQAERLAWEELEKSAGWTEAVASHPWSDHEAYALLEKNFTLEQVSLKDYIAHRKAVIGGVK